MFKKILIANRGIIRLACIQASRELGVVSSVFHVAADLRGVGERFADEVCVLETKDPFSAFYDAEAIATLAQDIGADAVHPGFGFLAESHDFMGKLRELGIRLISSASDDAVAQIQNKPLLKSLAQSIGVRAVPGTNAVDNAASLRQVAQELHYPLIVKPVSGVGGVGLSVVLKAEELEAAFVRATSRMQRTGVVEEEVFVEEFLSGARHIEVPVLRDRFGNVAVFPEIEASVQRRFQKFLSVSPAQFISERQRNYIATSARRIIEELEYIGLASVEFLVLGDDVFFLEINSSIQPNHLLMGRLTGINLVREQIRAIAGERVAFSVGELQARGVVVGLVVNAEDPTADFAPSPGRVDEFSMFSVPGVDVLTTCSGGKELSSYYDPMIAYVTGYGLTFDEVHRRMLSALECFYISGVSSNLSLLRAVMGSRRFVEEGFKVSDLRSATELEALMRESRPGMEELAAALAALAIENDTGVKQIISQEGEGYSLWNFAARFFERGRIEI
ncbi:MAG: biotin carboxylase N-terminal domain-containing protein [bacterium]|nr:biotin carboxylase N-terminal domain-containing protein [bacterium]